jgi:predicted nuclease of predicted toxin-antitoxin system
VPLAEGSGGRGHIHVSEIGLLAASDAEIADLAERESHILLSKDEDFLILRLPDRFGFLWLRCGNCTNRTLGEWLDKRWPQTQVLLDKGERFIELR